ncbi:hypothetical protein [uncultured Aquincola sp.]|uniref:hypothetical protein n=1 Tax=uncultured Aquincola sp. TaxID=886556 RepID=UPI0032B2BECA
MPADVAAAAARISADPQVTALLDDQSTPTAAKSRWNQFLELVRMPSPSREEYRSAAEIHRRMVNDWGFAPNEVMTRPPAGNPGAAGRPPDRAVLRCGQPHHRERRVQRGQPVVHHGHRRAGSNPLNLVANFGLEGGGIVNFLGSDILMQQNLPASSYLIMNLTGGNSVNSIASDGLIEVRLTAANAPAYQSLVAAVTELAHAGATAENNFRGVKVGDLTSGAPAWVRASVK